MRCMVRSLVTVATLSIAAMAHGQAPIDPSGHWEGAVAVPDRELSIEVDLARTSTGGLEGTIAVPAQHVKGLPLTHVGLDGATIEFSARADQQFSGSLSDEGRTIVGDFATDGITLPFRLTRAGEARVEPPLRSSAVGKEMAGTWRGTLDANGTPLRLVLTIVNQTDGTATAAVVNLDEGGLRVPVAIVQDASSLRLEAPSVGASYAATLNSDASELAGTFTQGPLVLPLAFQRADASEPRE